MPTQIGPGRVWKAFALGAGVWLAGTIALYFDDPSIVSVPAIADVLASAFFLCALLGYAFERPVFARNVWRVTVPFAPAWDFVYPMALLPEPPPAASPGMVFAVATFFIAIALVKYVALFRYAYRSDHVWGERARAT